jgi:hypothetical protein
LFFESKFSAHSCLIVSKSFIFDLILTTTKYISFFQKNITNILLYRLIIHSFQDNLAISDVIFTTFNSGAALRVGASQKYLENYTSSFEPIN